MNVLDLYTRIVLDIDYSEYRKIKDDVVLYRNGINANVDAILRRFIDLIDKSVEECIYIKGNRLFFNINDVKYWTILTCWLNEWNFIDQLIKELSEFAKDITYLKGELD